MGWFDWLPFSGGKNRGAIPVEVGKYLVTTESPSEYEIEFDGERWYIHRKGKTLITRMGDLAPKDITDLRQLVGKKIYYLRGDTAGSTNIIASIPTKVEKAA